MTAPYKKPSEVEWEPHFMTDDGKIKWIYTKEKDDSWHLDASSLTSSISERLDDVEALIQEPLKIEIQYLDQRKD